MSGLSGSAGRRQRQRRRWRSGDDRGYSIVEAAITLPALVLLCMIVVQFALVWHGRHVVQAAARDGLEAARGYQSTAGAGQAAAASYLSDVAPRLVQSPSVSVRRSATTVTVTVRASVLKVIPVGSFPVSETASGPVERFVTAARFGSLDGGAAALSPTGMWL
jgi:Flp pilus assembly protein TadG